MSKIIWLTGLSASGKTTIANKLKEKISSLGLLCYVLDGDILRNGLNSDLNLSPEGRKENIRRAFEVANLMADAGLIVICSFISPYAEVRNHFKNNCRFPFYEVFVNCPIEECIKRDPKGLYAKSKAGIIKGMTGIDAPYEAPEAPDLIVNTHIDNLDACVESLFNLI